MSLFYALLCSFGLAAILALAWVNAMDRADERARNRMPLPTARQLRRWKRERLDLNPALKRNR